MSVFKLTGSVNSSKAITGVVNKGVMQEVIGEVKTVEPTTNEQIILPGEGYNCLNKVIVNPVTSNIDENIKSENIVKDVEILGVIGTREIGYLVDVEDENLIFSNDITVNEDEVIL